MVWSREKYFIYGRYGILPEVLQPGVEGGGEAPATEEEDEDKKVKISSISGSEVCSRDPGVMIVL